MTIPHQKKISIVYKWPGFLFDSEQLYEGQVDQDGAVMANISSAKAAGLLETKEKIKKDDQDTARSPWQSI